MTEICRAQVEEKDILFATALMWATLRRHIHVGTDTG